ncbi:MAG: hypothetical protein R3C28_08310 [Pirellulaceae bacterium]
MSDRPVCTSSLPPERSCQYKRQLSLRHAYNLTILPATLPPRHHEFARPKIPIDQITPIVTPTREGPEDASQIRNV